MEEPIRPPTLGGLEGFELWDKTVRAPAPVVGIRVE